jgi:hypothetical protein
VPSDLAFKEKLESQTLYENLWALSLGWRLSQILFFFFLWAKQKRTESQIAIVGRVCRVCSKRSHRIECCVAEEVEEGLRVGKWGISDW